MIELIAAIIWVSGIVIAKGFWSTFFAVIFPIWSWYLVIDAVIKYYK